MILWHYNFYIRRKGRPVISGIYLTDGCNCRCVMCSIWKTSKPLVYPRAAQEKAIDVLSKAGCYYYSISGGETTLVKDLIDRLEYASRKIPYVHVVTNGLTMSSELARSLGKSGIKEISVSIDGAAEFHNFMRGLPYAFERAWNAVDLLRTYAPNIKVVVNSILTPYNLDSLSILGKLLDQRKGVLQKYLPLTFHELFKSSGANVDNLPGHFSPPAEMEMFLDQAISNRRIINSPAFLRKAKRYFQGDQNILNEQKECIYPYFAVEFDPEGRAYPCRAGNDFKNGLSADEDLEAYFESDTYRKNQTALRKCAKCRGCMMLCYYEPRLNFPVHKWLYYSFARS